LLSLCITDLLLIRAMLVLCNSLPVPQELHAVEYVDHVSHLHWSDSDRSQVYSEHTTLSLQNKIDQLAYRMHELDTRFVHRLCLNTIIT